MYCNMAKVKPCGYQKWSLIAPEIRLILTVWESGAFKFPHAGQPHDFLMMLRIYVWKLFGSSNARLPNTFTEYSIRKYFFEKYSYWILFKI